MLQLYLKIGVIIVLMTLMVMTKWSETVRVTPLGTDDRDRLLSIENRIKQEIASKLLCTRWLAWRTPTPKISVEATRILSNDSNTRKGDFFLAIFEPIDEGQIVFKRTD